MTTQARQQATLKNMYMDIKEGDWSYVIQSVLCELYRAGACYHLRSPTDIYRGQEVGALSSLKRFGWGSLIESRRHRCGDDPADIVFILDSSSSVKTKNFRKMLNFVKSLVDEFVIGSTNTKVAVLTFNSRVYNQFHLNKYTTKAMIQSAIDGIMFRRGLTYTYKAIKFAREESFQIVNGAREKSIKVAIIVTDGKSQRASETVIEAKKLRRENITIFSIGIGNKIKIAELKSMASDPDSSHVFTVDSFDGLKTIKDSLAKKACEVHGGWSTWSSSGQCSKSCGGGAMTQKRECNNPKPKNGGQNCIGGSTRTLACNTHNCPDLCTCRASGDPHYKTFDGQWIHFQGVCKYLLTELINAFAPCWLSVSVKNENRGNKRVSFTRSIDVQLKKTHIRLRKNGQVEIDGVHIYLPYLEKGVFEIKRSGRNVIVETSCGAIISWDGRSVVTVSIPGQFKNKLRGICGDCNGRKDDYKTKNGNDVSKSKDKFNLIGESWRVPDDSEFRECTPPDGPENCSPVLLKKAKAACQVINSKFSECTKHDADMAEEFFDNCLYDYCAYVGKVSKDELEKVVCNAIEGFAEFCKEKGITPRWRRKNFCPLPCGKYQEYDHAASGCPATCINPDATKTCRLPRTEACVCKRGYILSDDKCIKEIHCGCSRNGTYYPLNTRVTTCKDDEGEEFYCKRQESKAVLLVRKLCTGNFVCKAINQRHQCVCKDGYTKKGSSCKPIVHGGWSTWSSSGQCSKSCGGGAMTQKRECNNPKPKNGGQNCIGGSTRTLACNTHNCPVHGGWSTWSSSGQCSKSCGGGAMTQKRECNNPKPKNGGQNCIGGSTRTLACNTHNCPVHGGWSTWSSSGQCSKSCGGGAMTQKRECNNPKPKNGGQNCIGGSTRTLACNTHNCPVHGGWSTWSSSGQCSKSCGGGAITQKRECNNPKPKNGGQNCIGGSTRTLACNTHNCPVHGGWSTWSSSGQCSKSCGGGAMTQKRECNNPKPKNGGQNCIGGSTRTLACNTHNCPDLCTCRASGDPHYKTFDGQWIHFQGVCKYLLTELINAYDPCWLSVSVKNENRGNKRVSFTRSIDVQLKKAHIRLRKNGQVEIDGVHIYLPYLEKGVFEIKRSGRNVIVETSCGAIISWDGRSVVTVSIPGQFKNKLRGICGDCNEKKDDYKTKNGKDVSKRKDRFNLIGESWRVPDDSGFRECTPPDGPENCSPVLLKKAKAACQVINSKFSESTKHDADLAEEFFDNCLYDYCAYVGKVSKDELEKVVCNAIEGFAEFCKEKGITPRWRRKNFCPLPCGKYQEYDHAASGCPATCINPDAPKTCRLPKTEACVCKRGYILSDDKCIKEIHCGCSRNGTYYPLNTRVTTCKDDEGEEIYCKRQGRKAVLLVRKLCTGNFVCKAINQRHQCVCKDGYTKKRSSCKPIGYCLIKKDSSNCGVTLYGICYYESSSSEGCRYSVRTYKTYRGRSIRADPIITINGKLYNLQNNIVKDCVTITKKGISVVIQEQGCPSSCQREIILKR
ncbi:hypothetical protein FSP39_006142 [Pinctada imbricata]|uniref:Uncharacterized protein n=1 Tax=Pinctada imbricata TaxID=66713 RepID=A0AA88YAI2_PINIB|nr:hypothetical protein FSP39_006142 [Pinctada imbricata]